MKRIYRILELDGYARIDYRLSPEGELYFLERTPTPRSARGEDMADSALAAGISYEAMLQKILSIGLKRNGR